MSIEFVRVKEFNNLVKGSKAPLETVRNWYKRYVPYYYIELREYIDDEHVIDVLNTIGDEKMSRYLDVIISRLTSSEERTSLFEIFSSNGDEWNEVFSAFNKRIDENSEILNKKQYKILAEAYDKFQAIEKERSEAEKGYEEEVRKLVNAYSNNHTDAN